MKKGHAPRFGLVLIRAVRHLGVKSLLPLHAGSKRFPLAQLGRGGGRALAPPEATRAAASSLFSPRDAPATPSPASESAVPARLRGPERTGARSAALRRGSGRLWAWAPRRGRVHPRQRCASDPREGGAATDRFARERGGGARDASEDEVPEPRAAGTSRSALRLRDPSSEIRPEPSPGPGKELLDSQA